MMMMMMISRMMRDRDKMMMTIIRDIAKKSFLIPN
jgi:hypothetical protein